MDMYAVLRDLQNWQEEAKRELKDIGDAIEGLKKRLEDGDRVVKATKGAK